MTRDAPQNVHLNLALTELRNAAEGSVLKGYARLGVRGENALGVRVPDIRRIAKSYRGDAALARALWKTGIREARILATIIMPPEKLASGDMDLWIEGCTSWDLVDACCVNAFQKTPPAWDKAKSWCLESGEFVKRAGFVMIATLAVHDKTADDKAFEACLDDIVLGAGDDRNFVKKAVSWALREIGKRNTHLNAQALRVARVLSDREEASARWVGHDATCELTSERVRQKLGLDAAPVSADHNGGSE